ncbi:MAG: prohibitin family protein [Cytophagia bacterium]|nr:MAG: prohibitin family protein [Cytophagia bacterium]TAG43767.1 MAG: prohibitin family protein [Cytophagia bacterium]
MSKKTSIITTVASVLLFSVLMMSITTVDSGSVGVVVRLGAVQPITLPEGVHFVLPFVTSVVEINTRIQKIEANATASSKDLQNVTSKVALNYQLSSQKAQTIYQTLGLDYANSIIQPTIQESIKSATARYTAEELITKRPQVKEDVYQYIKKRLAQNNILVTDFSIVDFSFSPEFNRAIESKEVAKQKALTAKNDLDRIKTEAEQAREAAAGQADAQKLLQQALDDRLLQLKAIEKWNGILPIVQGSGNGSFIDVAALAGKK